MEGSLDEALSGIDLSLNKKESKYRELAVLKQFDAQIESEQKKEQESQLAYQKYEESVNAFSQNLLVNDRNKIRRLHQQSKNFIREQIQNNGGSYKKFMSNGGLRIMGNYRDSITNSEEALKYKDNAKNMASIIKSRDAGKASLISEKDLFNAKKYEVEGGGDITYSGLLSPIEKIDQNAYALGQEINAEDILKFSNNHSAILSNYMRENPEKGVPDRATLIKYTNKKYGAVGKNVGLLNSMNRKNSAKRGLKLDKDTYSIYSQYQKELKAMNVNADNTVGFTIDDTGEENYQRARKSNSKLFSNNKFTNVSETEINSHWYNPGTYNNDINNTRPKNAYESYAFNASFNEAAKKVHGQFYDLQSNTYTFPSSELIGASGNKLESGETHKVRPKTVIMAQVGKGKNPLSNNNNVEDFIAIEFSDKKGHLNTAKNKAYKNQLKKLNGEKTQLQYRAVEVWEDNDGYLFYKIMDTEGASSQKAWTGAIQNQDDYTNEVKSQNTIIKRNQKAKINQDLNTKIAKAQVKAIYDNKDFTYSIYKNLIIGHKLPKIPDIFESMVIGMGRSLHQSGSKIKLSPRGITTLADNFNKYIPQSSLVALRSSNLKMEDAYLAIKKSMMEEAENDLDKEQVNLFLDNWQITYEAKAKRKLNFKKS